MQYVLFNRLFVTIHENLNVLFADGQNMIPFCQHTVACMHMLSHYPMDSIHIFRTL